MLLVHFTTLLPGALMILLINGLFAQSLRYAQKIILGISTICLRLFFSHALILNENPHKSTESLIEIQFFRMILTERSSLLRRIFGFFKTATNLFFARKISTCFN